ncbi:hypothetical protein PINS_up024006 [Pythium insidiosum]|nr:hypothetical protein PINS_up024006 [Pythium insidiosum]
MLRARQLCAIWKIRTWMASILRRHAARRRALIIGRWVKLSYGTLRAHEAAVAVVTSAWCSYQLRRALHQRILVRKELHIQASCATSIQHWWTGLQKIWVARRRLQKLRDVRRFEMLLAKRSTAASTIQSAWRRMRLHQVFRHNVVVLKSARTLCAGLQVKVFIVRKLLSKLREERAYIRHVCRVQSWWRGMLVRLRETSPSITEQRKKISEMSIQVETSAETTSTTATYDASKPLTLGARLEMALHLLLHGKRLQEMLFASHTIEMCTRYSRECAWKCVQLKISNTIFAAIRGLNRSRPHVELLHQLLLVLVNLVSYVRKETKNYSIALPRIGETCEGADPDDLRAVDALVDMLHVHRDMHAIFVLASKVLKHYLLILRPHTTEPEAFEQWRESKRRLRALHELLSKKMQVAAWTSTKSAAAPSINNVMTKINPKTAVSLVNQLLRAMNE